MSRTLIGGITNRFLMLIAAGLLVLSYVAAFIDPARVWYLVIPALLFLPFAILNVFLLFWALYRRSKAFVIPFVALLPTLFFVGRYIQIDRDSSLSDIKGSPVRIVTYNVGRFMAGYKETDRKACRDSIFRFLKDSDADIICLQEVRARSGTELEKVFAANFRDYKLNYYVYTGKYGCFGNVILSRFPVTDKGVIRFEQSANLAVYADVALPGGTVRLYNCHFESYNISFPGIVKALSRSDNDIIRQTEQKVRHSQTLRPKQVDKVMTHISQCKSPTVLCGDFNDNPMSYTYQTLIKGHNDTFREAGKGFGATYSMLWPALRIDYILVPDNMQVLSHLSPKISFSDHYPVISEIISSEEQDNKEII